MPLPELAATGKENGAALGASSSSASTDDASSSSRKRRAADTAAAVASTSTDTDTNTTTGAAQDTDEVAYWKRQFYDLRNKRETEAEAQYNLLKERSEQRERALKNYTLDVERQLAEAKERLKEASAAAKAEAEAAAAADKKADANTSSIGASNDVQSQQLAEATATMRVLQQIISHYKMLTGIKLTNATPQSLDVAVRNVKRGTAASFRLTSVGSSNNEMSLRMDPLDGREHLPEYMRTAIEFDIDQCPALVREVLDGMFPDEQE